MISWREEKIETTTDKPQTLYPTSHMIGILSKSHFRLFQALGSILLQRSIKMARPIKHHDTVEIKLSEISDILETFFVSKMRLSPGCV